MHHYKVMDFIASDSLGDIYIAKDTKLDRLVALKRFAYNVDIAVSEPTIEVLKKKFLDDVRLFSSWDHPNLAQIYFFDLDDDAIPFYAMEYIPTTLASYIGLVRSDGERLEIHSKKFEYHDAVRMVLDICKGLREAHRHGVGHYNISPNNIMITKDETPKLVSFGTEEQIRSDVRSRIREKYINIYSAPEQLIGDFDRVGLHTDIYTLGLILYELISGNIPKGVIEPVSKIDSKIPKTMDTFFESILAEDPKDRIEDIDEAISQLQDIYNDIKPQKFSAKFVGSLAIGLLVVVGLTFGAFKFFVPTIKPVNVDINFTPQIPTSIYENLEPLEKYVFWVQASNENSCRISLDIDVKFRHNDGIRKKIVLRSMSDTTIGINPQLNIRADRREFLADRTQYIEWEITQSVENGEIENKKSISEGSEMVTMLALGSIDWNIGRIFCPNKERESPFALITSWIQPNEPKIKEVVMKASEKTNGSMVGYQRKIFEEHSNLVGLSDTEITRYQVKILYQLLQDFYEIRYDGGGIGQSINFPYETIRDKSANCVELSVLMASLLMEVGIEPVIVIVPNHAFIGWRVWDDEDLYDFVETTMLGAPQKKFDDAHRKGVKLAIEYGLSDFMYGDLPVDVFGKRGVFKKSDKVEVLNVNMLKNFKDSKGRKIYTSTPISSEN